jgi:hypothetical protein
MAKRSVALVLGAIAALGAVLSLWWPAGPAGPATALAADGPGTWTRISTGSGAFGWYFSHAAVERNGAGRIWHTWNGFTYLFDPAANTWTSVATKNSIGWRENFGSDHDTDSGVVWIGPGAPVAPGWDGGLTYSLGEETYRRGGGACSSNAVLVWDQTRKLLYCFAGWTTKPLHARSTREDARWALKNPSGTAPAITQDGARLSALRGGIDSRDGTLWIIGDNQELYQYNPSSNAWALVPTSGPKPHGSTVFTLHESASTIVGFAGCAELVEPCGKRISQTYMLDLPSKTWRAGPVGPDQTPTARVMVRYIPLYDRVRNRALLLVASDHTEVWEYTPSGQTPPPAAPARTDAATSPRTPPPPRSAPSPTAVASAPAAPALPPASGPGPAPQAPTAAQAPAAASAPASPPPTSGQAPAAVTGAQGLTQAPAAPAPASPPRTAPAAAPAPKPIDLDALPLQQFVARPLPTDFALGPYTAGGGSKHVRWDYDSTRKVVWLTGGDYTNPFGPDSEQPRVFTYDVKADQWVGLTPVCLPAGQIQPGRPDKVVWAFDETSDALYLMMGTHGAITDGAPCGPNGATQHLRGIFKFEPGSKTWSRINTNRSTSGHAGRFDPVRRELLFFERSGNDACDHLVRINVDKSSETREAFCHGKTFSNGTGYTTGQATKDHFALDAKARLLYVVAIFDYYDKHAKARSDARLYRYHLDTKAWTEMAKPLAPPKGMVPTLDSLPYVWDPNHRVLLWPMSRDACGLVQALHVWTEATNAWAELPVSGPAGTPPVRGNAAWFDPANNVMVVLGSVFCTDQHRPGLGAQTHMFLYRYAR